MYHSNDCVENFIDHIEDEVNQLYATFPESLMTEHTDVLEKEPQAEEKCHICFKGLNSPENR